PIVGLCVAIILFEGGLHLHLADLRVAGPGVRRLVIRGVPLNWLFGALAAHFVSGLSWPVAAVFGAIMTVTGPTVILPMLRQAGLNRRTASYLKWEGIVNDPVGVMLAVLTLQLLTPHGDGGMAGLLLAIGQTVLAGGLGVAVGYAVGRAFRAGAVPEYLKAPVMLAAVFIVYQVGNWLHEEAGLFGVTALGVVLGNIGLASIEDMRRFKEYIVVVLVGIVFILLSADISRETLLAIDWRVLALVLSILFITRPAATMLATAGAGMKLEDRLFLSWIAPRGIVAAATAGIMASSLQGAGYEGAESMLAVVFAVIFATVTLHGASVGWLARRLGLVSKDVGSLLIVGASPWSIALASKLKDLDTRVVIADSSWRSLTRARMADLPVYYGEILSENAVDSLEISQVSTVLAVTANDMYNALVCTAMAPAIGRNNVFQLPMERLEEDPRHLPRPLRGRVAFDAKADYDRMWDWHALGWEYGSARLSENYDYDAFRHDLPEGGLEILVRKPQGALQVRDGKESSTPGEDAVIVYFAPPRQKPKRKASADEDRQESPDGDDSSA
ncbi:MAG: sodium:proton antiporter, partial [Pseudomonadota bacterium]